MLEFQARTTFDSFYPMEVVATKQELGRLLAAHQAEPYLLFPEDRRYPIRMSEDLPKRWIDTRAGRTAFSGEAQRNEYYALQIGMYASKQPLEDLQVEFSDLRPEMAGKPIPATALRCFNLGGTDANGQPFQKTLSVAQGKVQPLWIGVDVAGDTEPGVYRGTITIRPKNAPPADVAVALTIRPETLGRPRRQRAVASFTAAMAGLDDRHRRRGRCSPYTPLTVDGRTVRCLGREVRFGDDGLPASIRSGDRGFSPSPCVSSSKADSGPIRLAGGSGENLQANARARWSGSRKRAGGPVSLGCPRDDGVRRASPIRTDAQSEQSRFVLRNAAWSCRFDAKRPRT